MATNKLSVYLNVNGAEEAEAKLKSLGKHGDVALKGITASAKPVNSSLVALNNSVGQVNKTMSTFAGIAGAYLGFQGIRGTISGIVDTNTEFQKLSASLEVTEKSAQKAKTVLAGLDDLAVQTPFSVQALTDAWIKLGNLGLKPSEEALLSYGNTASAMGKDIMQFIEAIADASTFEFERLKEFGIKASQQGDQVSFTFQGITTTVKKNSEEIEKYLRNIGNTTFAGSMDKQMDTIAGSVSNLGDNFARSQRIIGDAGFNDALKELYGSISNVVANSEDEAKAFGSALGTITKSITGVVNNLDILKDGIIAFTGFKALKLSASLTTQAITATTLATKNMALTLATSSAIAGKAATAQILAMNSIKVAANGLGKAMSLVGGPLGLIAIAGFSIYEYAKKSDSAAEASSKYAAELKQVEKNATSLTTATKKLNEETSKQTKLALLNDIDEAKKSIADIKDQIANTSYSDENLFFKIFNSNGVSAAIINLKQQVNDGTLTLEEFQQKLTSMGEQDINFRKPALKLNNMVNSLKASELALDNYQNKLNNLDNPTIKIKTKTNETPKADFTGIENLKLKTKDSSETIESLMKKSEYANSSVGRLENTMSMQLDSNSWIYGTLKGLDEVGNESVNFAQTAQQAVQGAFSSMEDSLVEFIKTGKMKFSDFANTIIDGLLRIQIQQSVIQPLSKGLSSWASEYVSGSSNSVQSPSTIPTPTYTNANVRHTGGSIGTGGLTRNIPLEYFANAPRYHTGTVINKDEEPAILLKGEGVVDRQTMNALFMNNKRQQSQVFNINVQNNGNSDSQTQTSVSQNTNGANIDILIGKIEGKIASNLSRDRGSMAKVLNHKYKLNGANL